MAGAIRARWEVTVTSDASGLWGCEAFITTGEWFQLRWPESWSRVHITIKELALVIISIATWGKKWKGKTMRCQCDNAEVVAIVNSGRSKMEAAMHLMRALFFFTAKYDITVVCNHIPGVDNRAADALSRDDVVSFLQQVPESRRQPSGVHPGLVQLLIHHKPDWTFAELDTKYFSRGLANSIQRAYCSSQKKFLTFCRDGGVVAVPASEAMLCWYVSLLAQAGLKYGTIKAYLSSFRHLHIQEGREDTFQPTLHRLEYGEEMRK